MEHTTPTTLAQATLPRANRALLLATLAFAACFSVWTLYAVMGIALQQQLALNATQYGILLAAPILSGALLRVPLGILADRVSSRRLWLYQMLAVIPALLLLPLVNSYSGYLWLGLWFGISGVSFTFGVRYVSVWFASSRQGRALGLFGVGNAGVAITFVLVPLAVTYLGWQWVGPLYAAGMLLIALLFALLSPAEPAQAYTQAAALSLRTLVSDARIWRFSLYYYFVFGSFLALLLWLPQYYMQAYAMNAQQAMAFTLFFVATSSMVRALGGWFADRYGGRAVNWSVFWVCLVCLFFLSYPPTTLIVHGLEKDVQLEIGLNVWWFTLLIFIIGVAQGFGRASVYKVIHDYYPHHMGSAGGFVAAIGALGGCTLPVLFGVAQDVLGIVTGCFMILYSVLALCMITMFFANQAAQYQQKLAQARTENFLRDEDQPL
ncbi:MFS transporter, NNP family, nitrate/nitrite transporter [Rheinheimera pacifica]|uniref:MFS transporter, NNP family, nitrate/nitrite transporter n=1 Tax=Rheinheimera pacifica TaxID=173990 RepID=A0A1H6KIX1_9GAMM|nr:MFS transporter [Rheinheimera pacifica]SEH73605.1 MFS transporter, NNP family, nitrate/nitrite transporter [Rheinheimera pacifica]